MRYNREGALGDQDRRRALKRIAITIALVVAGGHVALAQHGQQSLPHAAARAFSIESFGAFRNLMLQGDFKSKAFLPDVMAKHPTTGVGAVSDARGEITILDGKLFVSYGKDNRLAPNDESAALLAIGMVAAWQTIPVETDIEPAKVEAYLADSAKARRVDPEKSFPFQLIGALAPYSMHINVGPTRGP
jgi:hypothetical protein